MPHAAHAFLTKTTAVASGKGADHMQDGVLESAPKSVSGVQIILKTHSQYVAVIHSIGTEPLSQTRGRPETVRDPFHTRRPQNG